jgi:uncharacterized protein YggU (UPF0235/DUF167 family)
MAAPPTRLRVRVWKLRVTAPAEGGRANDAVVRLLAETVDVPRRSVSLVSGHTARDKVFELDGVGAAEVERRLAGASA